MLVTIVRELVHIMAVQLIITFIPLALVIKLFPVVGFTNLFINVFSILTLASYLYIIMFILILIMYYFDERRSALIVSAFFMITNDVLTLISLKLGTDFYGLGYFFATFMSVILAFVYIRNFLRNFSYNTFCKQQLPVRK